MTSVICCLECSDEYMTALTEVRHQVVNGCGPGGWKYDLIPDHLYGLSIHEACDIHDWDYAVGVSDADKVAADERFLRNLNAIINAYHGWHSFLNFRRRVVAYAFYKAVALAGDESFWSGKERTA